MIKKNFDSVLIIGMGLIGSSLSRAIYKNHLANNVFGIDINKDVVNKCEKLNLLLKIHTEISHYKQQFDLIIICTPLGTYKKIFASLNKSSLFDSSLYSNGNAGFISGDNLKFLFFWSEITLRLILLASSCQFKISDLIKFNILLVYSESPSSKIVFTSNS